MLAHLLYSFVTEEYPQVFYQNLSKKSQGSLFVSLFNFQGPLPLKERAFCILPHHRRFVNTFFSACPGFLPVPLSSCWPFFIGLHSLWASLSKSAWSFYQTASLLSISFSSFFSLSLHPPARCASDRKMHAVDHSFASSNQSHGVESRCDWPFLSLL